MQQNPVSLGLSGEDLFNSLEVAFDVLSGTRLSATGRAADLQWFTFTRDNGTEINLHVLCPWRLSRAAETLVASGDYWREATEDTSREDYERGAVGSRLRDTRNVFVRTLLGESGVAVRSWSCDAFGGFALILEADLMLTAFPDSSRVAHDVLEYWRLFEDEGEHFVVNSDGSYRIAEV